MPHRTSKDKRNKPPNEDRMKSGYKVSRSRYIRAAREELGKDIDDEEYIPDEKRARSGSPSSSSNEDDTRGNGFGSSSQRTQMTDVVAPKVCDASAFGREIVRSVMGDPQQLDKYPGLARFRKLIVVKFFRVSHDLEIISFRSAQSANCII